MAREIYLYSGIYSFVAENFNKALSEMNGEDAVLRVSSGGGDPFAGWPMVAKMAEHKGNIKIKVDGLAASMAAFILPYADEVEAIEVSKIMIHRADGFVGSNSDRELLNSINVSLREQFEKKINAEKFKSVTGTTIEEIFTGEVRKDVWLSAEEARKVGLVDKVITLEPRQKVAAEAMINTIAASVGFEAKKEDETKDKKKDVKPIIKNMKIEELKAQHPALAATLIAEGATNERDRVGAFMAFAGVDLEAVKTGIESGKALSQTEMANFQVKMMQAGAVAKLEEGSEEDLDTKGDGKEGKEGTEGKSPEVLKAEAEAKTLEVDLYKELGIKAPEEA